MESGDKRTPEGALWDGLSDRVTLSAWQTSVGTVFLTEGTAYTKPLSGEQ